MRLDRHLLGRSVRFKETSGETYDHGQFLHCIDRLKAILAPKIQAGERVAVFSNTSMPSLALAFALWELGISYFGDGIRARVIERAISLKVKYLFVDDDLFAEAEAAAGGEIELVRIPSAAELLGESLPADSLFRPHPENEAIMGFTSGSMSEPKLVTHTHESLYTPSAYMAENFYAPSDEVLIYINLNHLGFISCILLAAMRAGCGLHLLPASGPELVAPTIAKGEINVCPLFPYNWYQIETDFPETSLHRIDKVVTGGSTISQDFCRSLFAKGAKKVLNVYGLTEVLPPVSIKEITPENLSSYSGMSVGRPLPYVEVEFRDGEIFMRGANRGRVQGMDSEDGFIPTGDRGTMIDGELYILSRKKSLIIAAGREITTDDVLWFVRGLELNGKKLDEWIDLSQSMVMAVGNRLLLVLEREDSLPVDLEWLNAKLRSGLRPEIEIDKIIYFARLPFNGLKVDREDIRRQLHASENSAGDSAPNRAARRSPPFLRWQFGQAPGSSPISARSADFRLWLETESPSPGSFREEMAKATRALGEKIGHRTVALCHSGGAYSEAIARSLEQENIPYEAFFLDIYGQNTHSADPWLSAFEHRTGKSVRRIRLSREHFLHHHAPNNLAELGCDQPTALALTYLFEKIPADMFIVAGGGNLTRKGALVEKIAHQTPASGPSIPTPYSQIVHYVWSQRYAREGEYYFYSSTPGLLAATLRDPNFSWQAPFSDATDVLHAHFPEVERRARSTNWDTIPAEQENIFVRRWLEGMARDWQGMEFWEPSLGAMLNVEPLL